MRAKDLRERETADLVELKKSLQKDLFSYRMKNFTNQLEDTSLLRKTKQDIARIELILHERASTPSPVQGAES
jgi:large subunit ribosomal protein L29